jgi:hypothetical protein
MSKKWMWGLLLANALLFAWIRWGGMLTADPEALSAQAELHADKITLIRGVETPVSAVSLAAGSGVSAVPAMADFSSSSQLSDAIENPPRDRKCLYWGEFSGAGFANAQQRLSTLNLGARLQVRHIEHAGGFWVYMAPLNDQTAVQRKIAQLKALGVTDYFVVQEAGEWQRAISLGVFRTELAANNYLANLRKLGVRTAKVGERKSKLGLTQFVISDVGGGVESKVRGFQKEFPDSELKLSDCN